MRRRSFPTLFRMNMLDLLEAKCASCGKVFHHPSFGDFAYGEEVLCSADGKNYVAATAFSEFAKRVSEVVRLKGGSALWPVLAALADPIDGQTLGHSIRCAHCGSADLEYCGGQKISTTSVPDASFISSMFLSSGALSERIAHALEAAHAK